MSDDRELVRSRIDLVDLVSQRVRLKKSGKNLTGLCPFHEDKNPSFTVNPVIGRYKCWSCGASGDAFTWVMETQGVSFREALEQLAAQAGVELTKGGKAPDRSKGQKLSDALEVAVRFFQSHLQGSSRAREYCESRRLDASLVAKWEIGYAPDSGDLLAHELKKSGFLLSDCRDVSLVDGNEQTGYGDRFRGRLMFPIRDELGKAVGFGGRVIGDGHPKYINSSDSPVFNKSKTLYGLHRAKDAVRASKSCVIVEGYLDVIACHEAGVTNAVATLGTALSEQHVKRLSLLCDEAVLLYDSDEAGQKAAERGIEMFMSSATKVRVALAPEGQDPDTLLKSQGPEAVRAAVATGIEPVPFLIDRIGKRVSSEEEQYWSEIATVLARLPNPLEIERYLMPLAQKYPYMRDPVRAAKALRAMVNKASASKIASLNGDTSQKTLPPRTASPTGLEAAPFKCFEGNSPRTLVWEICLDLRLFITEPARRVCTALRAVYDKVERDATLDQIVDAFEDEAAREAFVAVLMREDAAWTIEEVAERLKRRQEEIALRAPRAEGEMSDEDLRRHTQHLRRLKGAVAVHSAETDEEPDPYA